MIYASSARNTCGWIVRGNLSYHLPQGEGQPAVAEQVISPNVGRLLLAPTADHHRGGVIHQELLLQGSFPPVGARELFGRPMVMVNKMIRLERGDEEATAQRTVIEQQAEAEAQTREDGTVEQFFEAQTRYETDLSQQTRAAVQQHALEEKAYYETRFHHLEANLQHRQALHNHNLAEKAIAQSRLLHQQVEESEQHYKTTMQREAENFANNLQQELQYHTTSNAQSQSLFSALRDRFRQEYDVHAEKWSHYSEEITQQAEEALQGLTDKRNAIGQELDWETCPVNQRIGHIIFRCT